MSNPVAAKKIRKKRACTEYKKKDPMQRFEETTMPIPWSGCHIWLGSLTHNGYGIFFRDKNHRNERAHRFAYALKHGPIPEGMQVCHSCDERSCVNPDHLFIGSAQDNTDDMMRKGRHYRNGQTHCKRGHEFSGENVYLNSHGGRGCKICRSELQAHNYSLKKLTRMALSK